MGVMHYQGCNTATCCADTHPADPPCGVAGNVVLYNVALLAQYGASALSAVWNSATFSNGPQPFKLLMQSVSSVRVAAARSAPLSVH